MMNAIFHADDWGLSRAINEGILELARRGWLRSASCMANVNHLKHGLDQLIAFADAGVDVYLHLNFTYGRPLTAAPSLVDKGTGFFFAHKTLMMRCGLGLTVAEDVRRESEAQLNRLLEVGLPVQGVNGHHHIHLLPGICGPLQEAMLGKGIKKLLMLKDVDHRPSYLQTRVFGVLGGLKNGIAPVYCRYLLPRDLSSVNAFSRKMEAENLPLLVHPALWNDFDESGMTDTLREARVHELQAILGYLDG